MTSLDREASYVPLFGSLARELFPKEGELEPVPYVTASAAESGLRDGSFDIIICVSVLEHVSDEELPATVREFARVLKRGGRLILTFDTGEPPIAKNVEQSRGLLDEVRREFIEDTSHGAPSELLVPGAIFTNHKATKPEFTSDRFSVSAHVFVKP